MRLKIVLLASALAAAPATAQESEQSRAQVYEAAFFAAYAPVSALDIARRVPGFTLDFGDEDVRGFGGAAGNVVINGARPSTKSESLEAVLGRIPARRVLRVELGPGDLYGAEYSGKPQVLNVVLSAESGIDGTITASLARRYNGDVSPNASASALIKWGANSVNLAAGAGFNDQHEEGTDTLVTLPDERQFEFRRKFNRYTDFNPFVSASYARETAPDRAFRINARFAPSRFDLTQLNRVDPVGGAPRDDRLFQDYATDAYEIGGDLTRPLAGGAIKLIGLATRRHRENRDSQFNRTLAGVVLGGFEQSDLSDSEETIGRLVWSRNNWNGWSVEMGVEGAYNRLESDVDLFAVGAGGGRTAIDLPIDEATVSERRGEAFVKAGRNLAANLRADAGLTLEYSNLTVSGDAEAERTLKFLKPSLALDWKPGDGWHVQVSAKRTVAQLNFFDFIGAAELANDRVDGGNAELLPQRAWEFRATVDRPLLGDGLLKLDLGYDRIELLQDRVLTEDGFDAPGNLGTGTLTFATALIDAPLTRLGVKGGRLKLEGTVRDTSVRDPLTGADRPFSDFFPEWQWMATWRQDLTKFAYGFQLSDRAPFAFYRTDEIDENANNGPYATAFVEYRPRPKTTITLDIDNALDTQAIRTRTFFTPNRSSPAPSAREFRERNRHVSIGLTLKQTFG